MCDTGCDGWLELTDTEYALTEGNLVGWGWGCTTELRHDEEDEGGDGRWEKSMGMGWDDELDR